jgi:predicted RNA-binding Zn-ribbon protein involved in translation (DUF1610 family)
MPAKHARRAPEDGEPPCTQCGEYWADVPRGEDGLCPNCGDTTHPIVPRCPTCHRERVPSERHHVATERQHPTLLFPLCLNCHMIITKRQLTDWPKTWQTEHHPIRCIVQGVLDLLWLWWHRSHSGWALGQLGRLCLHAGWAVLTQCGLVGWTRWEDE